MPVEKKEESKELREPTTDDSVVNDMFEEESIDDIIADAPVVAQDASEIDIKEEKKKAEAEKPKPEAEESKDKKEEVPAKEQKTDKDAEVKDEKPGDEKPEQAGDEKPEASSNGKITIGENEYDPEFLLTAITEYGNKQEWEKALRLKSVALDQLGTDEVEKLIPYLNKEKEIPDPTDDVAAEISGEVFDPEKQYTFKDDDGYDQKVSGKVLAPLVNDAVKAALKHYSPVLEKANEIVQSSRDEVAAQSMTSFMTTHPDYVINVPQGQNLRQYIGEIEKTGNIHPDHSKLSKFKVLIRTMQEEKLNSFDDAYNFLYGDFVKNENKLQQEIDTKDQTENKIIQKQNGVVPESPGSKEVKKDDIDELLDTLNDPTEDILKEIGAL